MKVTTQMEKKLDLNDIAPVENYSDLTIQVLVDRLARSSTLEHCIYRESELDEMWRLLDIAVNITDDENQRDLADLRKIREIVHTAHDLVGMDVKPKEAAAALREALS